MARNSSASSSLLRAGKLRCPLACCQQCNDDEVVDGRKHVMVKNGERCGGNSGDGEVSEGRRTDAQPAGMGEDRGGGGERGRACV